LVQPPQSKLSGKKKYADNIIAVLLRTTEPSSLADFGAERSTWTLLWRKVLSRHYYAQEVKSKSEILKSKHRVLKATLQLMHL